MKKYVTLILLGIIAAVRVFYLPTQESPNTENPFGSYFSPYYSKIKDTAHKFLPSPHAELLLGVTFGIDELSRVSKFKDALKTTGTIHVVVVSGFNITLLFGIVLSFLGPIYTTRNFVISEIVTLIYSIFSGFQPPVIRSWIMGSVAALSKYYGGRVDGLRILLFSGFVMIISSPQLAYSVSFQLSFLATLGLILYSNAFDKYFKKIPDLSSTLAAQVFVWPLISFLFGSVSLISPIVNVLVLWTIPVATMLGFVFFFFAILFSPAGYLVTFVVLPFLDFFVTVVMFFAEFDYALVSLKVSEKFLFVYLGLTVAAGLFMNFRKRDNKQ